MLSTHQHYVGELTMKSRRARICHMVARNSGYNQ